jgi:hypothetical protein
MAFNGNQPGESSHPQIHPLTQAPTGYRGGGLPIDQRCSPVLRLNLTLMRGEFALAVSF